MNSCSAQRNTYLTGFCLFLSLVLTRTFYIILELIRTQEEYAKLKKAVSSITIAVRVDDPYYPISDNYLISHKCPIRRPSEGNCLPEETTRRSEKQNTRLRYLNSISLGYL